MGRMSTMGSRGGRARWIVLATLAALGSVGYLAHQSASALVARSLNLAFANGDSESGQVWFDLNGDAVARDVVLYLSSPTIASMGADGGATPANEGANTLRFEKLRVRVPGGWMFYLRNLADRKLDKADVDGLRLSFEGFDTRSGTEPTLGTLGPIGPLSASPFEAEGCVQHAYFVRGELAEMGVSGGATSLDVELREDASRVATRIVLTTPGASRVQYDREETLAEPTSLLRLGEVATATVSERWDVSDLGFVRARNAWCAKQDGIDEATFVARHVAAVQRLLETRGLLADAPAIAAYRDFAEKGGQLAFGGTYSTPMHSSERKQARIDGSALLRLQGKLEHGSQQLAVQWSGTQPRPLDVGDGATFAAMTKENGGLVPAVGGVSAPAPTAIPAALVTSALVTSAPVSPAPQQAMPQQAQPRYASSLPSAAPPAASPGARLAWDDLPHLTGRLMQVHTMHAEPRTATLVSANAKEVHVSARMPGGHADYRISREAFVRRS